MVAAIGRASRRCGQLYKVSPFFNSLRPEGSGIMISVRNGGLSGHFWILPYGGSIKKMAQSYPHQSHPILLLERTGARHCEFSRDWSPGQGS